MCHQADYALTPSMAIVDPQLVLNMPKGLTAAGGIDAMVHALESYCSVFATGEGREGLAQWACACLPACLLACAAFAHHQCLT